MKRRQNLPSLRVAVRQQPGSILRDRPLAAAGLLVLVLVASLVAGRAWAGDATPAARSAGAAAARQAPAAGAQLPLVSQDALLARQARKDPQLFVLDVRTPQEFAAGHVPGAVNVPHDQVAARLAEVPRDKDVVIYCRSGRRTGLAAGVLGASGYTRLSHLEGDMNAWLERQRPVEKP
jgi:rhodanese-related sulfurtransferase